MKCPLQNRLVAFTPKDYKYTLGDCLKEECAWWDSEVQCCVVKSLRLDIDTIGEILASIKAKMSQ